MHREGILASPEQGPLAPSIVENHVRIIRVEYTATKAAVTLSVGHIDGTPKFIEFRKFPMDIKDVPPATDFTTLNGIFDVKLREENILTLAFNRGLVGAYTPPFQDQTVAGP
jgi:hypothetical protein